ncbi:hypothetical protein T484DRAFT_1930564 [Baffinella frigidus]|nr:hypothetical protein T484DRAFT_1930564 [Cryptophyta sp. CCMP2293]
MLGLIHKVLKTQGLAAVRAATQRRKDEATATFRAGMEMIVPGASVTDMKWSPMPPRLTDVEFWGALEGALRGLELGEGRGFQDMLMSLLSGGADEPKRGCLDPAPLRRHFVETLFQTASREASSGTADTLRVCARLGCVPRAFLEELRRRTAAVSGRGRIRRFDKWMAGLGHMDSVVKSLVRRHDGELMLFPAKTGVDNWQNSGGDKTSGGFLSLDCAHLIVNSSERWWDSRITTRPLTDNTPESEICVKCEVEQQAGVEGREDECQNCLRFPAEPVSSETLRRIIRADRQWGPTTLRFPQGCKATPYSALPSVVTWCPVFLGARPPPFLARELETCDDSMRLLVAITRAVRSGHAGTDAVLGVAGQLWEDCKVFM